MLRTVALVGSALLVDGVWVELKGGVLEGQRMNSRLQPADLDAAIATIS